MLRGIRSRLTYANVMATVAVFIALGGVSYAAVKLPKNSVGSAQIKKNAVTGAKVKSGAISAIDLSQAVRTQLAKAGVPGPQGPAGAQGAQGVPGAAGSARAYGTVKEDGTVVDPARMKNVVSVRRSGFPTGRYCIALAPSIDAATANVVVSLDYNFASNGSTVGSDSSRSDCSATSNEVEIKSWGATGQPEDNRFTFIVP